MGDTRDGFGVSPAARSQNEALCGRSGATGVGPVAQSFAIAAAESETAFSSSDVGGVSGITVGFVAAAGFWPRCGRGGLCGCSSDCSVVNAMKASFAAFAAIEETGVSTCAADS